MKVGYGIPLPPGLKGPTRGELRVRIERLSLQPDLIAKEPQGYSASFGGALVPVDHCGVVINFWGSTDTPGYACVPSTPAHPERGTQCCVFPVKTLEPQLQQYFSHMASVPPPHGVGGVEVMVTIPPEHSGKRKHIPVGIAAINLASLTTSTPIGGWFQVMSLRQNSGNDKIIGGCIGRIRLHFSTTFFAAASGDTSRAEATAKAPSPLREAATEAKVEHSVGAEDAVQHDDGRQPLKGTEGPSLVEGITTTAETKRYDNIHTAEFTHQQPLAPVVTSIVPSTSAPFDAPKTDELLQRWFSRGLQLRNEMVAAASGTVQPPSSHTKSLGDLMGSSPLCIPSLQRLPPSGADRFLADANTSLSSVSDTTMLSSSEEDSDDAKLQHKQRKYNGHSVVAVPNGIDTLSPFLIQFSGVVQVTISSIAFSAAVVGDILEGRPFDEMRFHLKLSRDVLSSGSPRDGSSGGVLEASSLVHFLPSLLASKNPMVSIQVPIQGYRSNGRIVIECFQVVSEPIPREERDDVVGAYAVKQRDDGTGLTFQVAGENTSGGGAPRRLTMEEIHHVRKLKEEHLLGLIIVDLCQQQRMVSFRHPLSGHHPLHALVDIQLIPSSNVSEEAKWASSSPLRFATDEYDAAITAARGARHKKKRHCCGCASGKRRGSRHGECDEDCCSSSQTPSSSCLSSSDSDDELGDDVERPLEPERVPIVPDHPLHVTAESASIHSAANTIVEDVVPATTLISRPKLPAPSKVVRLHVSILEAKELVEVSLADSSSLGEDRTMLKYSFPSAFVNIEDFFIAPSPLGASTRTVVPVEPWTVEASVQGAFTHTNVQESSSSPKFLFEAIVAIPVPTCYQSASSLPPLSHMELRMYHSIGHTATRNDETDEREELALWQSAALLGSCSVSLAPLKYLPLIDQWYKVTAMDVLQEPVGCLRVAVRRLDEALGWSA